MRRLRRGARSQRTPGQAPADSHGRTAVRLPALPESVQTQRAPVAAPGDSQRTEDAGV